MRPAVRNEVAANAWPVGALALAEAVQFMVASSELVSPASLYVGTFAKLAVLAAVIARPGLLHLLERPGVAACIAVVFAASIAAAYTASRPAVLGAAAFAFYCCETASVLAAGRLIFRHIELRDTATAALGGVLVAFCAAVVLFALPRAASVALQTVLAAVCALAPAAASRVLARCAPGAPAPEPADVEASSPAARGRSPRAPRAPLVLLVALCFYTAGIQLSYLSFWQGCDWASAFAFAVVVSAALVLAESRATRMGGLSLIDLVSATMVAVPALFAGAGLGDASLLVSMSSIGFYLFLPRIFQIAASVGQEGGADGPVRVLAEAELAMCLAEAAATLALSPDVLAGLDATAQLGGSTFVAVGCMLSAFALYEMRTRSIVYSFIEERPAAPARGAGPDATGGGAENAELLGRAVDELAGEGGLTRRERDVLAMLGEGASLSDICDRAGVSMSTAKSHVYHIYQKLGVHSRQELADALAQAGRSGL